MNDLSIALKQIPPIKLFLMHPYNRRIVEGAGGRAFYEIDQLMQTCSFAGLTAILLIAGFSGLIFFFDVIREHILWSLLALLALLMTAAMTFLSLLEYDRHRRLRTLGTAIPGRIVDFKITGSDPTTAVATYEFTTPEGETTRGQTKELPYRDDAHFYHSRAIPRLTLFPKRIEPKPEDQVVVLYLSARKGNLPADDYDIL